MAYKRMSAELSAEIPAPADAAWALLVDWAGLARWWPKSAPFQIGHVVLVGEEDAVPRTRKVTVAGAPTASETLLLADPLARRIYYVLEDGGIPVLRNYLATTTIDSSGPAACTMRFASTFDVAEGDEALSQAIVLGVYATIRDGFRDYFATPAAS